MTTTETKRRLLQAQPGKKYHYNNDNTALIDGYYAAYMASNHPSIKAEHYDSFAIGEYKARQCEQRND